VIVGGAMFTLARRRWVRVLGALYPAFMLFDIVATGNHFWFDAAAGGAVVAAGWALARLLVGQSPEKPRLHTAPRPRTWHPSPSSFAAG
jgi:hypothetical protein